MQEVPSGLNICYKEQKTRVRKFSSLIENNYSVRKYGLRKASSIWLCHIGFNVLLSVCMGSCITTIDNRVIEGIYPNPQIQKRLKKLPFRLCSRFFDRKRE